MSPEDIWRDFYFGAEAGTHPLILVQIMQALEFLLCRMLEDGLPLFECEREIGYVAMVLLGKYEVDAIPESTCALTEAEDAIATNLLFSWGIEEPF